MTDTIIELRRDKMRGLSSHFCARVATTQIYLPPDGVLAGPVALAWVHIPEEDATRLNPWAADNFHFAMNVELLLQRGFAGIAAEAERETATCEGEKADYLRAIAACYRTAMDFANEHARMAAEAATGADSNERMRLGMIATQCAAAAQRAPHTFREAVQLFWFAWNLRGHGTIGRLDQHLWPFYRDDMEAERITREAALALMCELWEGFNRAARGDTLQNLMLGGQDRDGRDATNPLSLLMLDAALAVRQEEPHLNARLNAGTPDAFLDRLAAVQALGHGQGTIYADEVIIPALVNLGVPLTSARNYANDGCTEVTIDGESRISFVQVEALKSLELTLFNGEGNVLPGEAKGRYILQTHAERTLYSALEFGFRSGDFATMRSFDEVYQAFIAQYLHQVGRKMAQLCDSICYEEREGVTAPFLAGTFPECLATGVDPLRGSLPVPCHIIFSGSLPTVADGLAAIKQVVFEDGFCSPAELLKALRVDWVGYPELHRRCLAAPKYGNDDDFVDLIAADLTRCFCRFVTAYPTPSGKPFWPALFNYLFNDEAKVTGATPDGRRWGEPMAEHYSPTPGRAKNGPTAVMRSAAKSPLADACGSAIFHISLTRSLVPPDESGTRLLRQLITSALALGISVMNTAIYDIEALREAQQYPDRHSDLLVRVWGFSARFIELSSDMQNHIIARTIDSA